MKLLTNRLKHTLRVLVGILTGAYLLLLFVLNFGPSRSALTHEAAQALSEKLGTKVSIGDVELGLFNRLIISDLNIEDKQGLTMLKAERVTAKIELRSLLRSRLSLRTVSLLDADIQLYKQRKYAPYNFQFVIDAFASKEPHKPSKLDLRINSVILRRVNVAYDLRYLPHKERGMLDAAHLKVSDINANISVKALTNDGVNLRVRSFSLREQSGLEVTNLRFKLEADRRGAEVRDFEFTMPHSRLQQSSLTAVYDATNGWYRLLPTLRVRGDLNDACLSADDVRCLVRLPKTLHTAMCVNMSFLVLPTKIQLNNLNVVSDDGEAKLDADVSLLRNAKGIFDVSTNLSKLEVEHTFLTTMLPQFVSDTTWCRRAARLGDVRLNGYGHYRIGGQGNAKLQLLTDVGRISADALWQAPNLKAHLSLMDALPARLMAQPNLPQRATLDADFNLRTDGKKLQAASGQVLVKRLDWKGKSFGPIDLSGNWDGQRAAGRLLSSDPSLSVDAEGHMAFCGGKPQNLTLSSQFSDIRPSVFGLASKWGNASYSATLKANLTHLNQSRPLGTVDVDGFEMKGGPHGDYKLDALHINSLNHANGAQLTLNSDFADATLTGPSSIDDLVQGIRTIAHRALPGLLPAPKRAIDKQWTADVTLRRTDVLKRFTGGDIALQSPLLLNASLHTGEGRSFLAASTDGIVLGGNTLSKVSVFMQGRGTDYTALAQFRKEISGRPYKVEVSLATRDSALEASLDWRGDTRRRYEGRVSTLTRFSNQKDFSTIIRPTSFLLADTVWNVSSGELSRRDSEFAIRSVCISRPGQSLAVDGAISPHRNDSIEAHLDHIDISYILSLINFDAVEFGGLASGTAVFLNTAGQPRLHARLNVPDFRFNKGPMGNTDIIASWNASDKRIQLDADMHLPDGKSGTKVQGYVSPAEKGLDLSISAQRTDLRFLRRYIDGIFGDFGGDATGYVRLYGPFKKLDFTGEMTANARARVLSTGVEYAVTDGAVHLKPGAFEFDGFRVTDGHGGSGRADGVLHHQHLKHLTYEFDLTADHLLCYDMPQQADLPFSSTTYGTGNVHLQGWPSHFTADINLRPDAGTSLVYTLGTADAVSTDNAMVRFHEAKPDTAASIAGLTSTRLPHAEDNTTAAPAPGTDILLNFFIDANPQAQVKVVTDPRAGDNLTMYGYGPIRATFHNKGAFEMYGTYRLTRGIYKLSIQDVIRKDLVLQEGSRLTFAGDPLAADLDIHAKYTVNGVSLSDLNYGAGFSRKSVKVDCLLNIGGKARSPQIAFDLDLQNISEDEKQMVRQLIATDEDMNRQIIYLLGVGRFYTASNSGAMSQVTTQQQSTAAMRSFLSTTLSSQFNSAISNVLGSRSHWNFGANVAPGTYGWNDIEVEGLLEGRLFNDRLLINGNFGYRDRPTYTSNFVGDFDIRYLLTPKGTVSLRAYSETTDRYFTKNSLTTQGIGLMLQRDFKKFKDLFLPQRKKKKTENAKSK